MSNNTDKSKKSAPSKKRVSKSKDSWAGNSQADDKGEKPDDPKSERSTQSQPQPKAKNSSKADGPADLQVIRDDKAPKESQQTNQQVQQMQ